MFYSFLRFILKIYYALVFRLRVSGAENIPETGSAVICSNHISAYDPLTLAVAARRQIHYMAKKELFSVFLIKDIIRAAGAFPVDRSKADLASFKEANRILKSGGILGIFAQGTRVKNGDEKAAKAGVALFAIKNNAPVVPVYISGNYGVFSKITVNFGSPMLLSGYNGKHISTEELEKATEEIMQNIKALKTEV